MIELKSRIMHLFHRYMLHLPLPILTAAYSLRTHRTTDHVIILTHLSRPVIP